MTAANTAFSKAEQYAQQTANSHKNILKAVEQDCEIEDNPCQNGLDIENYSSSKLLKSGLRQMSDDKLAIGYTRFIAGGTDIRDIQRLVDFYASGNSKYTTEFSKYSTGEFELNENVLAPNWYFGKGSPKNIVFCQGDVVEGHWYQYTGKNTSETPQHNQKFEYKLKCKESRPGGCKDRAREDD